jgi:Uncharacterized protein conserved in bacteria
MAAIINNNIDHLYALVNSIKKHAVFAHPVDRLEIIETHISYVLLTGPYAYKFKKPVNLGFLDFSTLEQRKFYCHEEIRLNRRLAPELYLEVIPITGSKQYPVIGGEGPVQEYAVKMAQFPKGAELDQILISGNFLQSYVEDLLRILQHSMPQFRQLLRRVPSACRKISSRL